jgi:subtilase family serine protease
VRRGGNHDRRLAGRVAVVCAALAFVAAEPAGAFARPAGATPHSPASSAAVRAADPTQRRVFLLGLRQPADPAQLASQLSDPASRRYRRFLSLRQYQQRFAPTSAERQQVLHYLTAQRGVVHVELSSDDSVVLAVLTEPAGEKIFCARGEAPPARGLCTPRSLRRSVREVSAGEVYQLGGAVGGAGVRKSGSRLALAATARTCAGARKKRAFTPQQLSTAYDVDPLHSRGLLGSGIRVATLSSQELDPVDFKTWARCFGFPTPRVRQFAMPGASPDTATAPEETSLDVDALLSLAPRLQLITPIFVPLDQGFSNSFLLFMFAALDPSRQRGTLPDVLSISDGVCESRFSRDELQLGQRLLAQAAALGITTVSASGDSGFRGCFINKPGTLFPASSRFTTGVGGTALTLTPGNHISNQVVWSTFASQPDQGAGSGGGPSDVWRRPSFQRAPGIGPQLQRGTATRLVPDVASMASFTPGIVTYEKGGGGWAIGGGTSAATPLTAAIVALVLEQERKAHRPRLGSLPPLLYALARGPDYHSIFFDVTKGTSSRRPHSAAGQTPGGGAAQPGYDLATGLGSLNAAPFARAVAALGAGGPAFTG